MANTSPIKISDELKTKLRSLADQYEVASFCDEDPSQFLKWYVPGVGRGSVADVETASFIAAMLAFGNRKSKRVRLRIDRVILDPGIADDEIQLRNANFFYRFQKV